MVIWFLRLHGERRWPAVNAVAKTETPARNGCSSSSKPPVGRQGPVHEGSYSKVWRCGGGGDRAIMGTLVAGARGNSASNVQDGAIPAHMRQTRTQLTWNNGGFRRHQFRASCGFALSNCAEQDRLCVWQV
jgi:hypothetical protein